MELKEIGATENEIQALAKKKIYTAEALLRKPPLHRYDFSKIYELDYNNEETKEAIDRHRPFAIYGRCISIENDYRAKCKLKIVFEDLNSKLTEDNPNRLYVNYISFNQFRQVYYTLNEDSPHNMSIDIPEEIQVITETTKEVNEKCKKAIDYINILDKPDIKDYFSLKTNRRDEWSTASMEEIASYITEEAYNIAEQHIKTPSALLSCLKWYCRGLNLKFAIIKTLLDDDYSLRQSVIGKDFKIGGFIEFGGKFYTLLNPPMIKKITLTDLDDKTPYFLQYSSIKGLTDSRYRELIKEGINRTSRMDIVPYDILHTQNLPSIKEASRMCHYPKNYREQCLARDRDIFNDLLYLALRIEDNNKHEGGLGLTMKDYSIMKKYVESLPYKLTNDQENAVNQICKKISKGIKANALIQGDVGSGKTAVAFCLAFIAVASGYQCSIAAPYTTLAMQHYEDMKAVCNTLGLKAVLLTSDIKKKEREEVLDDIETGKANIIIGTHSIFGKAVRYKNLGFIILDEEHKFGVVHRDDFEEKAVKGYHKVIMSATPIPKSLAATVYGDAIDVISIIEKPANRLPIQTAVCIKDKTIIDFIEKQVKEGRQAYIVCPAIAENEKAKRKISTIEQKSEFYKEHLPFGISFAVVTGKMKTEEKKDVMTRFKNGEIDVLMATTVIEVGINVPNATLMVITGADNFGFSTLHQLRGRVGRSSFQSYCILQADNDEENEKLQFMCQTNDGFKIAEKDLELRGPGSLFGERQTGDNYYISLMLANQEKYQRIKEIAKNLCIDGTGRDIVRRYEELYVAEEER